MPLAREGAVSARPDPVALTGVGILTPLGDHLASVSEALLAGRAAIAAKSDSAPVAVARMTDFEAARYANVRGMRIYNRTTRLGICATRLALADAGLENSGFSSERLGVVMASTFGHLDTLIEYDRSLVMNGPSRTNPALMPLALPSAPGAVIALSFAAKACSITLGNGGASSLDALGLGARLVRAGRVGACVVVAAFGLFDELVLAAERAGQLARAEEFRVFDRQSRGTALGEAAVAVVLESTAQARERGAKPKALVSGQASTFHSGRDRLDDALARACTRALREAAVESKDVTLVGSGANGVPAVDDAEARALLATLGASAGHTAVTTVKAALGDTVDASGLLQAACLLPALRGEPAPAIAGFGEPSLPGLRYLAQPQTIEGGCALVTSTSQTGACSALVLERPADGS
jgi:3-oxoacyl-[acyl-carrier-protein] synthase II